MLYLWISLEYHQGGLFIPNLSILGEQLSAATPTWQTIAVYWGFILMQIVFAYTLPGIKIKGLPVPT